MSTYERKPYSMSDTVKQAQEALQKQQALKPAQYSSQWQGQIDDTLGKMMNREKFSYDVNEDAMYQQAAQRYIQQGRQAMMDTMGQAQAMTGGYGNSYAQSVGQQAYQGYLEGLNDQIPDFYQMALNQYLTEGDRLRNQYGLLTDREALDYGRHRDSVADWNAENDRLYQQLTNEKSFDYGMYADEQAYNQWLQQFLEDKRRYDQEWLDAHPVATPGGGGGDDNTGSRRKPGNPNLEEQNDEISPHNVDEYVALKKSGATSQELKDYQKEGSKAGNLTAEEIRFMRNARY